MIKLKTKFAFLPTKLTNGEWIWLENYKAEVEIKEYDGFEEGIGNIKYRTYKTLSKWKLN